MPPTARSARVLAPSSFDGVILGVITRLALGDVDDFATAALLALLIQFLYFFVLEAAGAQTLGKRPAHIRVVRLDGSQPTLGQVVIRRPLRIFDALPLHVVFPTRAFRATCPGSSSVITVRRRAAFVMHFDAGGCTKERCASWGRRRRSSKR
jgi:uncharacterized RDD family membrane protein YckC